MVEKIEVNLIPNEYRVHSKSIKIPQDIILSVFASVLAISVTVGVLYWNKQKLDEVNSEITKLSAEIVRLETQEKEIGRLKDSQEKLRKMRNGLMDIHVDRDTWIRLMEIYCRELPLNTWIYSIEGQEKSVVQEVVEETKPSTKSKGGKKRNSRKTTETVETPVSSGPVNNSITIKGRTEAFGEVGQFMARLQSTPTIKDVKIIEVKAANTKESSFEFEISHTYQVWEVKENEEKKSTKNTKRKGR